MVLFEKLICKEPQTCQHDCNQLEDHGKLSNSSSGTRSSDISFSRKDDRIVNQDEVAVGLTSWVCHQAWFVIRLGVSGLGFVIRLGVGLVRGGIRGLRGRLVGVFVVG